MNISSETISHLAEATYVHKRIVLGDDGVVMHAEFAFVTLRLEPVPSGGGVEFVNAAAEQLLVEHVVGIQAGVQAAAERGVLNGGPVVDIRATLLEGRYHDMDSNKATFAIAAREAFWEAMRKAGPRLD